MFRWMSTKGLPTSLTVLPVSLFLLLFRCGFAGTPTTYTTSCYFAEASIDDGRLQIYDVSSTYTLAIARAKNGRVERLLFHNSLTRDSKYLLFSRGRIHVEGDLVERRPVGSWRCWSGTAPPIDLRGKDPYVVAATDLLGRMRTLRDEKRGSFTTATVENVQGGDFGAIEVIHCCAQSTHPLRLILSRSGRLVSLSSLADDSRPSPAKGLKIVFSFFEDSKYGWVESVGSIVMASDIVEVPHGLTETIRYGSNPQRLAAFSVAGKKIWYREFYGDGSLAHHEESVYSAGKRLDDRWLDFGQGTLVLSHVDDPLPNNADSLAASRSASGR